MYPLHTRKAGLMGLATFSLMGAAGGASAAAALPAIDEWIVVGPFPQRLSDGTDFLAPLGGELKAVLKDGAAVTFTDAAGQEKSLAARRVTPDASGTVDLARLFPLKTQAHAYLYTEVTSDTDQALAGFLGSDDWAKVWVNGEVVYARSGPGGRTLRLREDHFPITLRKGTNRILAKVDQDIGGWAFSFELASKEELDRVLEKEKQARRIQRIRRLEVGPRDEWSWIFEPGSFPEIAWKDPDLAAELWSDAPLKVRWFDADLNEVMAPSKPGRYGAYVEAAGPDGQVMRRSLTFYCSEPGFAPWWMSPSVAAPYLKNGNIDPKVWDEHQEVIARGLGQEYMRLLHGTENGAILLAGLSEMKPLGRTPTQLDSPEMRHQDYHLRLKRKLLGIEGKVTALAPPHKKGGAPATVLHEGTPAQADVKPDAAEKIRAAARAWSEATGIPCSVLVARHGVIVLHEAFGGSPEFPVTVKNKFGLASLTKTHTGLLFAQFLDQGLISLDDPVGKYLPGFPTSGSKALTLRHCLTNTSGLEGHGEWGGMMNPWLDNAIAVGKEGLAPGAQYIYNGMGYDLSGKVMEVVSGKSIFRLFHENFFQPLGQEAPNIVDLAFGIDCTVADLARVGQLMLNRGSYGDTEFFRAGTFEKQVRPRPLKEFFPDLLNERDLAYNMGMNYATDGGAETPILGKNTLTHGSATGAVLRVDYDHDLVVAMGRPDPGPDYDTHLTRFLQAVADGLL